MLKLLTAALLFPAGLCSAASFEIGRVAEAQAAMPLSRLAVPQNPGLDLSGDFERRALPMAPGAVALSPAAIVTSVDAEPAAIEAMAAEVALVAEPLGRAHVSSEGSAQAGRGVADAILNRRTASGPGYVSVDEPSEAERSGLYPFGSHGLGHPYAFFVEAYQRALVRAREKGLPAEAVRFGQAKAALFYGEKSWQITFYFINQPKDLPAPRAADSYTVAFSKTASGKSLGTVSLPDDPRAPGERTTYFVKEIAYRQVYVPYGGAPLHLDPLSFGLRAPIAPGRAISEAGGSMTVILSDLILRPHDDGALWYEVHRFFGQPVMTQAQTGEVRPERAPPAPAAAAARGRSETLARAVLAFVVMAAAGALIWLSR